MRIEALFRAPSFYGGERLSVEFLTAPEALARLLPPPFEPAEAPLVVARVGAGSLQPPADTAIFHSSNTPHRPNPAGGPRYTFAFGVATGSTPFFILDGGAFETCRSAQVYRGLKRGRHIFRVMAVGAAGDDSSVRAIHFLAGRGPHR